MAKRKKNLSSPITLFSFQDIVTSLTGIMILIVLMLILGIIESKFQKTVTPAQSNEMEETKKLRNTLDEICSEIKAHSEWLRINDKIFEDALSADLESLPKLVEKEEKTNRLLLDNISISENDITQHKKTITDSEIESKKYILAKNELEQKVKDLEKKKEQLVNNYKKEEDRIKEELEKKLKSIKYTIGNEDNKRAVLVECSNFKIKVKISDKAGGEVTFIEEETNNVKRIIVDFTKWLKVNCKPETEVIFLIIKPSSSGYILPLSNILDSCNFQYGMEPAEEDTEIIF